MKKFLLTTIFIVAICSCVSQKKMTTSNTNKPTTMDLLEGKMWLMQFSTPQEIVSYDIYKKSGEILTGLIYNGKEVKSNGLYYLSDTIPKVFNSALVGNMLNGKYIISKSNRSNQGPFVHEIIQLDSNNLVLKYLRNNSILTYKAKEK